MTRAWVLAAASICAACGTPSHVLRLSLTPEPPQPVGTTFGNAAWLAAAPRSDPSDPARAVVASRGGVSAARFDHDAADVRRFHTDVEVDSGPLLLPGLVLFGSGDAVVALSSETGQRAWSVPAPGSVLLGATQNAELTALLFGTRAGQRWLGVYDRARRERLRIDADGPLGTPLWAGRMLLVPFGAGFVSAVDVAAREELRRVRVGSELVHALVTPHGSYFGGPPWLALGSGEPLAASLPRRPLPGRVLSGSAPHPASESGMTRLYVRPARAHADLYMATHERVVLGLRRADGHLEWVTLLPGRALGAELVDGGLLVCDDSGTVRLLAERTGQTERQWPIARERRRPFAEGHLVGCALSGGRVLDADARDASAPRQPPLLEQIARVLASSDPGLLEAQRFLSRELAERPEPEATELLIQLVRRPSLDRVLQSEARDLLAARRNGERFMLAALEAGDPPSDPAELPPIAPLAEALAALGVRRAAPLIARQLNHPAHAAAAVARAARALEQLASDAEYDELSVFFSLHRTTADNADAILAVLSVAKTLLRVGGPKARHLIQLAARDPLTVADVRAALESELERSRNGP